MNLRKVVARNLRRIRDETGLTQEELAHRSGLNRNYVGMISRCENAPTVDVIEKLGAALSVAPARLFEGEPADNGDQTK